jgi:hypothetical protein
VCTSRRAVDSRRREQRREDERWMPYSRHNISPQIRKTAQAWRGTVRPSSSLHQRRALSLLMFVRRSGQERYMTRRARVCASLDRWGGRGVHLPGSGGGTGLGMCARDERDMGWDGRGPSSNWARVNVQHKKRRDEARKVENKARSLRSQKPEPEPFRLFSAQKPHRTPPIEAIQNKTKNTLGISAIRRSALCFRVLLQYICRCQSDDT